VCLEHFAQLSNMTQGAKISAPGSVLGSLHAVVSKQLQVIAIRVKGLRTLCVERQRNSSLSDAAYHPVQSEAPSAIYFNRIYSCLHAEPGPDGPVTWVPGRGDSTCPAAMRCIL
jgi:hypothetical protein